MRVIISYFGPAREIIGREEEEFSMDESSTVADLRREILARYPAMELLVPSCRIAVDMRYAGEEESISEGAEIALIPPVAGG